MITTEDRIQIAYERGETPADVARDLPYSAATIRSMARDLKVPLAREGRTYGPEFILQVRYLADNGHSHSDVAERLGIPRPSLTRLAARYGIRFTPATR